MPIYIIIAIVLPGIGLFIDIIWILISDTNPEEHNSDAYIDTTGTTNSTSDIQSVISETEIVTTD